jgi:hypothetical protein
MIACFLDLYANKGGDGKLTVGPNQSFVIQSSWAQSGCPGASNLGPNLFGQTINYSVTDISGAGVYDRKIEMLGSGNSAFAGVDQWLYLKVDNGVVTFAHDEHNLNPAYRSINFAYYNPTAQVVRAQFITTQPNLKNIYRLYSNGSSDKFALLAHHAYNSGNDYTWFVLTGKATNPNIVTVAANYDVGTPSGTGDGCFNYGTDAFTDTFNSCNSISGIHITNPSPSITTNIHASNPLANSFSPNFSDSDIKTAATGMPQ